MNKRILTLILTALFGICYNSDAQVLHYMMKKVENLVYSKWENDSEGNRCLNYYNNDYCHYLHIQDGDKTVLRPGKNTVYKRSKGELESPYKYGKTYYLYRGCFPNKKFDPFFTYALPFKDGARVRWKIDRREPKRTLLMQCESCDTVYASRSGVACRINPDKSSLLVYHNDCTFAGYMNMTECFISPGQQVNTGDPIGISNSEGLSMTIFFLDENLFADGKHIVHPYTHIMPVFRTDKGDIRLETKTIYRSVIDADILTREMSKSERKRYLKRIQK